MTFIDIVLKTFTSWWWWWSKKGDICGLWIFKEQSSDAQTHHP